jgi:hypothetical protein
MFTMIITGFRLQDWLCVNDNEEARGGGDKWENDRKVRTAEDAEREADSKGSGEGAQCSSLTFLLANTDGATVRTDKQMTIALYSFRERLLVDTRNLHSNGHSHWISSHPQFRGARHLFFT